MNIATAVSKKYNGILLKTKIGIWIYFLEYYKYNPHGRDGEYVSRQSGNLIFSTSP